MVCSAQGVYNVLIDPPVQKMYNYCSYNINFREHMRYLLY